MSEQEEWGPWIEHDGSEKCPFRIGDYVQTVGQKPGFEVEVNEWIVTEWASRLSGYRYVHRYRVRKPRALQQLREIAEGIREPVEA